MAAAADVRKRFGDVEQVDSGSGLHISFNYFCCYMATERGVISSVLRSMAWPALNVSSAICSWLDPSAPPSMRHVGRSKAAGVDVHVPRAQQEPFHTTLAVVSGEGFPAAAALAAIDKAIAPGTWSRPIPLSGPPSGATAQLVERR